MDPTEIERELIRWINSYNEEEGVDVVVTADSDLVATSALDSMGFVGLIALFENLAGVEIDFDEVDPEELTSIRSLFERCL